MKTNIKISIIIPVYNVENYLEECLNSALNQTLKEIEIIAVNDGSTDRSPEILNKYQNNPTVTIINQSNQGLSVARNVGLKKASGEYIMFLDSDDWIDADMCEKLYNKAKKFNVPLVICDIMQFWENGKSTVYNNLQTNENRIYSKEELYQFLLSQKLGCHVMNKLYLRYYMNLYKCSFEPGIYYEDLIFSFKIIEVYGQAIFINQPLYKYRMRKDSIVATSSPQKIQDLTMSTKRCVQIASNKVDAMKVKSLIQAFIIGNKTYALYLAHLMTNNSGIIRYINKELPIKNPIKECFFNPNVSIRNKLRFIKYTILTLNL